MSRNIREIPESQTFTGITDSLYFERTGKIREKIGELSKEEALDYIMFLIGELDTVDSLLEKVQSTINKATGYAP